MLLTRVLFKFSLFDQLAHAVGMPRQSEFVVLPRVSVELPDRIQRAFKSLEPWDRKLQALKKYFEATGEEEPSAVTVFEGGEPASMTSEQRVYTSILKSVSRAGRHQNLSTMHCILMNINLMCIIVGSLVEVSVYRVFRVRAYLLSPHVQDVKHFPSSYEQFKELLFK